MNIGISIAIFLVFLAGIIALQVFYFKTDRKLLLVPAGGLGIVGGVVGLLLSTYYGTALDRVKTEIIFNNTQAVEELKSLETYIIICIFAAIVLFASIIMTVAIPIVKKILDERGILSLDIDE